jgi:hypothetical protein
MPHDHPQTHPRGCAQQQIPPKNAQPTHKKNCIFFNLASHTSSCLATMCAHTARHPLARADWRVVAAGFEMASSYAVTTHSPYHCLYMCNTSEHRALHNSTLPFAMGSVTPQHNCPCSRPCSALPQQLLSSHAAARSCHGLCPLHLHGLAN